MGKIFLNSLFDLSQPFVDAIADFCRDEKRLSDVHFSQACDEFKISEEEAMQLMTVTKKYNFFRLGDGWNIEDN